MIQQKNSMYVVRENGQRLIHAILSKYDLNTDVFLKHKRYLSLLRP